METNKLRISFSLLNLWMKGRVDDAVKLYLHQPMIETKAMILGKKVHQKIEEAVRDHKTLKIGKTIFKFKNPQTEMKLTVPYNERWNLVGVIDAYDEKTIYEWKTGVASSLDYANTFQVPFYFLLCQLAKIEIERAIVLRYQVNLKKADWVLVWNSGAMIDKAKDFIDGLAPEIEKFFEEKGIIKN